MRRFVPCCSVHDRLLLACLPRVPQPTLCVRACVRGSPPDGSERRRHPPTHPLTHSPTHSPTHPLTRRIRPAHPTGPIHIPDSSLRPTPNLAPLLMQPATARDGHRNARARIVRLDTLGPIHSFNFSILTVCTTRRRQILLDASKTSQTEIRTNHVGSFRGSDERLRGDSRPHYHE